ncbi:fe-s metabolism associated domain-containing protein [Cyclospora cayetanensis]|uniref:Fe-s metabolism associated domain-containing protein n=1 Tax=Cyclospora cayetanensis TaxID=88456 RepID=A0A1D3D7Q9_9EIME|nr:fe-s metabolism associated domain-containing protein [Cyclospora cayetanensis]
MQDDQNRLTAINVGLHLAAWKSALGSAEEDRSEEAAPMGLAGLSSWMWHECTLSTKTGNQGALTELAPETPGECAYTPVLATCKDAGSIHPSTSKNTAPTRRMQYLMTLGAKAVPLNPVLKTAANKVKGCISEVYVHCTAQRNSEGELLLFYVGDSNAVLTSGLLQLLLRGLHGSRPSEVLALPLDILKRAKLQQFVAISRMNGFVNILRKMKEQAAAAAEEAAASASASPAHPAAV